MNVIIERPVKNRFPNLRVKHLSFKDLKVRKKSEGLEHFKLELTKDICEKHNLQTLKDVPIIRLYRDFFWKIGIDPTKIRPASEALIRRVLKGGDLPVINTLVDTYNLASIESKMALAAFDEKTIRGDLAMRFAEPGEEFQGIGMNTPIFLKGGEPIIRDVEKIIAVYPYRDSDETKVTLETKDVVMLVCGVPGIDVQTLEKTGELVSSYIGRFCS